jgi:putative oxidoreductase
VTLALSGFCILTALILHSNFADLNELVHFNKDIAIVGGLLGLIALGAGHWFVDALQARRNARLLPLALLEPRG